MTIQISFNVLPDKHGVVDGRELARQMLAQAYLLLVPYATGCYGCASNLFSVLANRAIDDMQKERTTNGDPLGIVMTVCDPKDRQMAELAHMAEAVEGTKALLLQAEDWHDH